MISIRKDGGWSWFVLFSVMCSQTILGGICFSSGLFYVIFKDAFNSEPVEISWLCSLPMTFWYTACPFGSFLTNKYGCRKCAFIGGVVTTAGLTLGYFASSTVYLFVSHGFLTGFGLGINYTACMTVMNKYFDRYKTIATGIASIGHNIGLILNAKGINYLQESYGWRGMTLVQGAIAFNLCACACAMFPLKSKESLSIEKIPEKKPVTVKLKRSINLTLFRKLSFVSFCASNIFTNLSLGIYILHLPSYSKEVGFAARNFGTVLMVFGIATILGKVIYSLLGQHPRTDETSLYAVSLTATGICICLTPVFLTKTGMLTLAGLVGFFYCVTGALLQTVIYRIVGFESFADGIGLSLPFKAVGNIIGGPLTGFLLTVTGKYTYSFYLSGICMITASALMLLPIISHRRRDRRQKNTNIYTICELNVPNDDQKIPYKLNGNENAGGMKKNFEFSLDAKESERMLQDSNNTDEK
ncbi:monocarboxylate transporter 13-like [Mercenaria mercenaria]|uniref:monocarboxylate transporter 13-like n=1 Tax=Mercenaria mercenaria TaxID=6596 RepID=UPI00234E80AD|nr:monocarboxylate transporter 13-like [Mercenaria mercenaria]XP_045173038.2 monocarboxylate transporter 13-like [Mercenaria mercenaria]XP_045173039.2 monocarboxylate transporter 13-like [Mercenaria mercenaria]